MYIKRISLQNIRCFEELEISFDKPGSSLLILGDNGVGKSTVLRSLAMGLCDESSASALFRELPGEFVRRKTGENQVPEGNYGTICVDLEHEEDGGIRQYRMKTMVASGKLFERVTQHDGERVTQKVSEPLRAGLFELIIEGSDSSEKSVEENQFPWDKFFVSGYGAGSRSQGTADYRYYLPVDAIYPIFNYTMSLQNPELAVRRLVDAARKAAKTDENREDRERAVLNKVKTILAPILGLNDEDSIELTSNAILVTGPWGKAELGELGDGYKATITWVLDLLSWWFLYFFAPENSKEEFDSNVSRDWEDFLEDEPTGIVIIDEIDQHLHPRWQHSILKSLTQAFPGIQFIVTTHSPMTVLGTTDVEEDCLSIVVLKESENGIQAIRAEAPKDKRADQVLTSSLFDLPTASSNTIKTNIAKYARLVSKQNRSDSENELLAELQENLDKVLGSSETELESAVRIALKTTLNAKTFPIDAQNYEIKRQLVELFGELDE